MINQIIQAIAASVQGEFGERYTIYSEEIKQGLKEPCFFIMCLNPVNERFLGRRFFRENSFVIQYFPEDGQHIRKECNAVAEGLNYCLEWITVTGDKLMGSKMRYEIVDGVLHFFVNYNLFVHREYKAETMETLELEQTAN